MKKFWKIFFITLLSLFTVTIAAISIALWLVFTPERFTPIVRNQAEKYINCKSEIGEVELTFFSTFPNFGLKVNEFALINPVKDAPNDTLVKVKELVGVIDTEAWRKRKELVLVGLELTGGSINVFSDSLGLTNYDIFSTDTATVAEIETETVLPTIDIQNIVLTDVNLQYKDLSIKLNSVIRDLSAKIAGTVTNDSISGNITVSRSDISFEYEGEKYLQDASVKFNMPVDIILSRQFISLKQATASINNLEIMLNGTVENDTDNNALITDIDYKLDAWQVKNILPLVPPSFHPYLEGIDIDGLLSSHGSIKGLLTDSVMPLMDINLLFEDGKIKYAEIPLPLHDIEGDIDFYSDLKTDAISYVRINRFKANTPQSSLNTSGLLSHLFTDVYCKLTTKAKLRLDEFNPLIPDSLKIGLKGKVDGALKSEFSLSQLENMQLERMRISASLTMSDLDIVYDSISLQTDRSKIEFSLPNNLASSYNTKFVSAKILMDNMVAGKLESYHTSLLNVSVALETSDIRDTTRIPYIICSFNMDSVFAAMDTMSISIAKPNGKVTLAPRTNYPDQPRIILAYNSENFKSSFGQSTALANKIDLNTDILNDNTQEDIFLQWLVKGSIEMDQGNISMAGFSYPIEIPSIQMNFDPETFNIKEGKMKIDKSDFQLTGNLNNILSYFRGDSILRGEFNFHSNTTDVAQLMALTSGLGESDTTSFEQADPTVSDTTSTGPYMVPRGIDVLLSTNIKTATLGTDTASNIIGNVRVKDGVLVLDGLTFETPAARMQLTAMYRTPRKNHLYLGLDYHMMDVEIGELLTMIPDIDSLMPMLRSFGGKGEFHLAVETYLDSLYNVKKSTLRGASSIKGNNLVLMDGETFSEIAKTLKFNKHTENKVDSLAAEFTIFRNEIDIYPFLIVMDKYKAVVAGRHNFDMSFNYHISVVDCPLPVKLGVDVIGNEDDLSYKLAKCRYAEYYRPVSRKAVENKQLELSKMIRETLTQKVKNNPE